MHPVKTGILNVKSHSRIGPGGWKCNCCGPPPKYRKLFARKHKKRIYRFLDKFYGYSSVELEQ